MKEERVVYVSYRCRDLELVVKKKWSTGCARNNANLHNSSYTILLATYAIKLEYFSKSPKLSIHVASSVTNINTYIMLLYKVSVK